jgi:K+-transporting ATPase ATPase A chain
MTLNGWFQIALMFALVIVTARPLGIYMASVFEGRPTLLDPVLRPVEKGFYALAGVDAKREQDWLAYTLALLVFNAAGFVLLYAILRLQHVLPLNPQGFDPMSPHLAFNTAASFVSNTNWQSYGGESTLSYFSQMAGLTVQNFVSAATGFAVAVAVARAFARSKATTVGNFWVDLTRATLYVLLPLSMVLALALVAFGMPQNLSAYVDATTLEGAKQTLAQGPVAGQVAIKQLGTNGGGFFNVNAAHPYENPSAWTNLLQTWAIFSLALALAVAFGRMIGREREG